MPGLEQARRGRRSTRQRARWILRLLGHVVLWTTLAVVALVTIGLAYLHSDQGRAWLRDRVVAALDSLLAGQISIGHIEGSVIDRFSLHDVEVRDDEGVVALRVDEMILDTDLWRLLQQRVAVDEIILERLQVTAKVRADGSLNLAHVIEPQPESEEVSPWIVSLDRLAVHDGSITWTEASGETVTHIDDLDIETSVLTGGGDTTIELEHLTARWREGERALSAHVGVHIQGEVLTVHDVDLRLGEGRLTTPFTYYHQGQGSLLTVAALHAPRTLIARLAPDLGLASDIGVTVAATRLHQSWPVWLGLGLATGGGRARIYGAAIPEQPAVSLHVAGHDIDLASILPGLPRSMVELRAEIDASGDSLATLAADATIALRGRVEEQPIDDLRVRARMREQRAEVQAGVRIPAGTLDLDGAVDLAPEVPVIDDARVRVVLTSLDEATAAIPEFPGDVAVSGEAEVDVRVSGPIDALTVAGQVSGRELRWRDIQIASLTADMNLHGLPGRIRGSASLVASDVMQVEQHYGDVEASVSTRAPGELAVALRVAGENAVLPLFVSGTVRQGAQATDIELEQYELTTAHVPWRGQGGGVRLEADGGVHVRDIALRSRAGEVAVNRASIEGPRTSGAVTLDRIDLAEIGRVVERMTGAPALAIAGTVSARATIDRRGRRTTGTLALEAKDLAPAPPARTTGAGPDAPATPAAELPTVDLTAALALSADALAVDLRATSDELGSATLVTSVRPPRDVTDARAWQALDERALTSLELCLAGLDLARLRTWAPDNLTAIRAGKVAADIAVTPGADSARAAIDVRGLRVTTIDTVIDTPLDLRLDAGLAGRLLTVDARLEALVRGQAELHATATLPGRLVDGAAWAAMDERALRGARVSVEGLDLDYWLALAGVELDLDARGALTVTVAEAGQKVDLDAQVVVPPMDELGLPTSTIHLAAALRPRDIEATLAMAVARQRYVHGTARWQLGLDALLGGRADRFASAPARIDLTLDDLPLALVGELLALPAPLCGQVRGTGRLTGSLANPDLAVDLRSHDAVVAGTEFPTMAIHGAYQGDRLRLVVDSAQAQGGMLNVDALVRLTGNRGRPTGELSLYAKQFDIGFLGGLVEEMEIGGALDANLTIQGSADAVQARGTLHLRQGTFHAGPPLRRVHEAELRIELEKDRLWLRQASARAGNGRFAISGTAELDGLVPRTFQARVTSDALPLELGTKVITLDTDLRIIHGQHTREGWTAETIVKRALIRLPDEEGRELHEVDAPEDVVFVDGACVGLERCAEVLERQPEVAEAKAVSAPVPLRIAIRARDTIEVRSQEARAIVGANLVVDTRSGALEVNGAVTTSSGYIELFGRRYQVQRAVASFGGTTPAGVPDPALDILLAHEFTTLTLFLQVQGTVSDPELELHSEPGVYDDATLLSFVLGADPSEPDDTAEDGGPSVSDRAVGAASSLVVGEIQGLVQEVLPVDIDVLRVELAEASASAERLIVGKWITDELLLSYSHNFVADPNESTGEVSLEYRFRKRWLIDAYFGNGSSGNAGGLDLLWSKRF